MARTPECEGPAWRYMCVGSAKTGEEEARDGPAEVTGGGWLGCVL